MAKKLTVAERDAAVVDSAFRLVCLILDRPGILMLEQAAQRAVAGGVRPSGLRLPDAAVETVGRLGGIARMYAEAV